MHRIDTPTAQKDKFGAGKNGFTAGNPQTGTPATDLDNDYFDMLQEELAGVVEATGISLDKSKHNQLLTAMKALLLSRAHPFADIKADGAAAVAEAIENLGLKEAAKLGVATSQQMQTGTATNLLPTVAAVMSLFSRRAFGQNDFVRIPDVPGGLIIQWGKSGGADSTGLIKVNLPTTFTNSFQNAQAIYFSANRRSISAQVASLTATELQLWASYPNTDTPASGASLWWIAIGN